MAEQVHTQGAPEGAETGGGDEQGSFGDPSGAFPGQLLIMAHQQEADQIGDKQNDCRNDQFHGITSFLNVRGNYSMIPRGVYRLLR